MSVFDYLDYTEREWSDEQEREKRRRREGEKNKIKGECSRRQDMQRSKQSSSSIRENNIKIGV
jgi:hypothetical protein